MLFLLFLLGLGTLIGGVAVLSQQVKLSPLDDLASYSQTSYLCTAEVRANCNLDNATAQFSAGEDRVIVSYSQIPQVVVDAVVATEDGEFFTHIGVDPYGIARALVRDLRNQGVLQGGSTITQQLVKIELLSPERTLVRKLREATLAIKLEREMTKEEILTRYLNIIYFGRGAYGIQAAAQAYFGKDAADLDLADSAFLAGLIRAPSTADPVKEPDEATRRRATTLELMVRDGLITSAQAEAANQRDWSSILAAPRRQGIGRVRGVGSEYFVEAVRQQMTELEKSGALPEGGTYTAGLRIYTTLDPRLQTAAYNTVTGPEFGFGDPTEAAVSIVAVDEQGFVRAMMAGKSFEVSQVNLALGRDGGGSGRQPGSAFKPFVLAEALEQGFSARSYFSAPPVIEIPGANEGNVWRVKGGASSEGYRDLVDGLRVSSNVVYAQLMVEVGPRSVVELANRLGISAELPEVNALVLGSGEVSVLDMASAYSTLANQGVSYQPILIERIENQAGEVLCWYPVDGVCAASEGRSGQSVLDGSVANQVTFAMQQVVGSGTGSAAGERFGGPAAGKTGTTQDARDAWFVGYTCDLTAAVWMGFVGAPGEDLRYMQNYRGFDEVHGGDFPAEMWADFMEKARLLGDPEVMGPCDQLPQPANFPGIQLNPDLSTTTLPPCAQPAAPETTVIDVVGEDGVVATVIETLPPPTTQPCEPPEPPEGESTTTVAGGDGGTTTVPGTDTTAGSAPTTAVAPATTAGPAPTTAVAPATTAP